ncbi:uncharacterized protein RJT20DRAFT_130349 [Scheffersomyces xylosifermentans]|uniref:uncharacterized protein n=1 Tax=Scheffersomyces xylosifermentans TaxID=1304137 RepID=UPI00315DCE31
MPFSRELDRHSSSLSDEFDTSDEEQESVVLHETSGTEEDSEEKEEEKNDRKQRSGQNNIYNEKNYNNTTENHIHQQESPGLNLRKDSVSSSDRVINQVRNNIEILKYASISESSPTLAAAATANITSSSRDITNIENSNFEITNNATKQSEDSVNLKADTTQSFRFADSYIHNKSNSTTRSSSPFISHPELDVGHKNSDNSWKEPLTNNNSIEKEKKEVSPFQDNNSSYAVDDLEENLENLRLNFSNIRLKSPKKVAMSERDKSFNGHDNDSFHNSTMDTTRYNDTRAQLDHDINFDVSPSKFSRQQKRQSMPATPWRNLRTASMYTPTRNTSELPQLPFTTNSMLANNSKFIGKNLQTDISTESKVDELSKKVTSYKIQLKVFKQFLQNLIDKTREFNQPGIDLDELQLFQNNLYGLSPAPSQRSNAEYNSLQEEYDEIYKLNQDLFANLESFQSQLHDKEVQLQRATQCIESYRRTVDEIIHKLIIDPNTLSTARQGLQRCLVSNSSLEVKLQVLKLEVSSRLEASAAISKYATPPASDHGVEKIESEEVATYISIVESLTDTVAALEEKFHNQQRETERLEEDLQKEVEDSKHIKKNFQIISQKFSQLCKTIDEAPADTSKETKALKEENDRLTKQIEDYQARLDGNHEAEKENDKSLPLQSSNSNKSPASATFGKDERNIREELLELSQAYSNLSEEFNELTEQHAKLKSASSSTISSLTNQLNVKQKEVSAYRAEEKVNEKIKLDLEIAVEKQRKLNAEKIKLSYTVESLKQKEASLKTTIESLSEKVTALTVAGHSDTQDVNMTRKLNVLEYQLQELLSFDLIEFQKFIKSFNKIADDVSLKDPKKKFELLRMKIIGKGDLTLWENSEVETIRDQHRSIFEYFARAVDILVNDHVRLLLKESDLQGQSEGNTNAEELRQQIRNLQIEREALQKQVDSYEEHEHNSEIANQSPMSKLRIEDLRNKWKAERERRVYEDKEAQRRFRELEMENSRLRDLLNM